MRVGVVGAAGRMGSTVCAAVAGAEDMELVAGVDPAHAGEAVAAQPSLRLAESLDVLAEVGAEVVVDFSHLSVALETVAWCAGHDRHLVVGTSGFGPDQLERAGRLFPPGGSVSCLVVPNFAISAVLAVRFAELAAPWFDTAEVIELHHDRKVDAPSGTAMATAERLGRARQAAGREWEPDPTRDEVLAQARGGLHPGGVRIHSIRMRGMVAHEEIILGTTGQTLTIRQDSYDRESYMPGVLAAIRAIPSLDGLVVGLDTVLGI